MWINKQKLLGTISQPTLKEILRAGWSQNYIQWRYRRTAEPQWMNVLYPPEPGHFIGVAFHFFQKSFIKVFLELQKLGFLLFFFSEIIVKRQPNLAVSCYKFCDISRIIQIIVKCILLEIFLNPGFSSSLKASQDVQIEVFGRSFGHFRIHS